MTQTKTKKPAPTKVSAKQRRMEILKVIASLGHPDLFNRKEAAKHYGVNPSQITRDVQWIGKKIKNLKGDELMLTIIAAQDKSIKELLRQGDYVNAARAAANLGKFMQPNALINVEQKTLIQDKTITVGWVDPTDKKAIEHMKIPAAAR